MLKICIFLFLFLFSFWDVRFSKISIVLSSVTGLHSNPQPPSSSSVEWSRRAGEEEILSNTPTLASVSEIQKHRLEKYRNTDLRNTVLSGVSVEEERLRSPTVVASLRLYLPLSHP